MASRSRDWLDQARGDLETAQILADQSRFDWASFVAQQSAEKAAKAVLQARGHSAWGHVVADLLRALAEGAGVEVPGSLAACGAEGRQERYRSALPG